MSNFSFLKNHFNDIWDSASRAEKHSLSDPRACCFYARHTAEVMVKWLYDHDGDLVWPYSSKLVALIKSPSFLATVPTAISTKLDLLRELGNHAVHGRAPSTYEAMQATHELYHCCRWLAQDYAQNGASLVADLNYDESILRSLANSVPPKTKKQLQSLETELEEAADKLREEQTKVENYEEENAKLKAQIAEIKKQNEAASKPDYDYDEEATRDLFIDLMLREAGWDPDYKDGALYCREYKVTGMPNEKKIGYVDYVLWGQNGKPLAVVEAKRAKKDPRAGQQQAKLYADCLEAMYGQRPIIFYTNGYTHWLWDDQRYPPREVSGFLKADELELAIQRRTTATDLATLAVDKNITDRPYSEGAIRAITEGMMTQHRKALVVMATGTGKTRMSIALVDLLQRANWAKRVLFLADRVSLVKQAMNAFKNHLPQSSPVNLVTQKEDAQSRVYGSTYPTMMGLIDDKKEGENRFGPGYFDLIIIDEAHRSVYQKYRHIFEYFDAHLVGLTATPRDEVDRDTYGLFNLTQGDPTYAYDLDKAIEDRHLVPPKLMPVPLKIPREGITRDKLSDEEKEYWDLIDWDEEDGDSPDKVEAAAIHKWLFNKDTVDKALEHVMTEGIQVDSGQKIGKTIIFAKNHDHAIYIEERFNANYPHYKGHFARVIDNYESYAQDLIDKFSMQKNAPSDAPQIAISVDMLDTGIDVPDVVNLVFFKIVRSKTKFWQMIGRGTRKCADLFGDGLDKEHFIVFDYCGNFEFFNEFPKGIEGSATESTTTKIFRTRLELLQGAEDSEKAPEGESNEQDGTALVREAPLPKLADYTAEMSATLHGAVAAMNVDNFIVRRKRQHVETYQQAERWNQLTAEDYTILHNELADLPTEQEHEHPTAKQFDLILLRIQLGTLQSDPGVGKLVTKVKELASALEELESIPDVKKQMVLIQAIQDDEYWEDVTLPMLEIVRKALRNLIQHIERKKRKIVYTDIEDELGEGTKVTLSEIGEAVNLAEYKRRLESYLKQHEDHITLQKVKMNQPLTKVDLQQLEDMLFHSGEVGDRETFERSYGEQDSLGIFLRGLVGLDREAAKQAFASYLDSTTFSSQQIEFINQIIEYLTQNGVMDPKVIFKNAPFTVISPQGPGTLFSDAQTQDIVGIIRSIKQNASAA